MNKKELVKQIADKNGVSIKEAQRGRRGFYHKYR